MLVNWYLVLENFNTVYSMDHEQEVFEVKQPLPVGSDVLYRTVPVGMSNPTVVSAAAET